MPAFNRRTCAEMYGHLSTLKGRMRSTNTIDLSPQDVLDLFAHPEHHQLLKEASRIANISSNGWMNVNWPHPKELGANLHVQYGNDLTDPPLMPKNAHLQEQAPPGLVDKVTAWVTRECEINRDFRVAEKILSVLHEDCKSGQQVRYLWPTVLLLCRDDLEGSREFATKYREYTVARGVPSFSTEFRQAMRTTAGTIAAAALLDTGTRLLGRVMLTISTQAHVRFCDESLRAT